MPRRTILSEGSTLQKRKPLKSGKSKPARRPSAPGTRKRRSADDLLNRIIKAAREEFKRCGFAGTTTAVIARKADVTEAQLFRYFGSKSNLFRETVFKPLDQQLLSFTNEHVTDDNVKEMSHLYTSELQRFISANSEMFTSLIVAQTYDCGTTHGVGKIDSLHTYFDHGASRMKKRLKGKPRIKPELMVRLAFVSVLASIIFKDWIFPDGLATSEEIQAAINGFVMEGIGANSPQS
jgi:AcrR family transcriptional regulator